MVDACIAILDETCGFSSPGRMLAVLRFQKEAKELLEGEWNSMYWTRDTILTLEEYQNDPENWERAMEHARAVMKKRRDDRYGTSSTEDNEEDDDEDDEEEEVEAGVENSEIEEVEVVTENDGEDDDQAGSTSEGGADVVASKEGMTSGKPKKKAGKAETEVATQVKMATPFLHPFTGNGKNILANTKAFAL